MRKFLSLLLTMAMVLSLAVTVNAAAPKEDITILHTNDVHCDYEKYAKVATLHKSADLLVDAGDHVQGGVIGTLSKGEYIVDIMNYLKYDAAVPGNHEFDYGMDQFLHIAKDLAKYPYISANFTGKDGTPYFDAYKMFEVKGVKVAFVGVCTPETFTKSTPTYFQDANGNYIFGFCEGNNGADLYKAVQSAIDAAKAAGADYVIGLGHLGIDEQSSPWMSKEVIANTTGFDAFIDGHSHSTFSETIKDKSGKEVVFEQTGTKLANVGKLTIKTDGTITHENVDLSAVEEDADAKAYIAGITEKFDALQKKVVAKTTVTLTTKGADGKRAVRSAETNLGDLCADAYRLLLGADVAFVNGGGVRADINAGDITYGDIINVHPFGNSACLVEVTGQQLKDALELGSAAYPGESGGFLQVSGLTYTINADIPSSVVKNDKSEFVKVDGAYRVSDIMVGGQPLDVNKTYTLASHNYMLKDAGDGYTMFGTKNVKVLQDEVMIDNQVLINYIVEKLGGVVGAEYAAPQGRITIKTAPVVEPQPEPKPEPKPEPTPAPSGDTYTVVAGDCLWNIAYKLYGTGTLYTKLAEANKIADPYIIYIGQILTVPAK
ncbi:MAG: 5'-nucleotidase C-terminal domain-containing protein [Oscillospiraceae bacterium]|jgi:2',3'-cyclic-nucleotide 2'-phosphodiesterase (5'-nucleotidase family)|nr:5'-nucleotidase C-terminal domain-containing protein [Oscillospiraceae bacterium]